MLTVVSLFTIACSKPEDGAPGPAGTANVMYSNWQTASTWTKTTSFGVINFSYDIPAPKITTDILNTGEVLVYAKLNGYNSGLGLMDNPVKLTYNITYSDGTISTDTWSFITSLGNIKINFVNNQNLYQSISILHQFRYIIIPGGTPVATGKQAQPDLKKMSYAEVCQYCQIPE